MADAKCEEVEKRLRAVRKKLAQIDKLKEKKSTDLDQAAREKLSKEGELKDEEAECVALLPASAAAPRPAAPAAAPSAKKAAAPKEQPALPKKEQPPPAQKDDAEAADGSPASPEKRIKVIRKKLQQVEKLREKKGAAHDADARAKIASEAELRKELSCLERGEVYVAPEAPVQKKAEPAEVPQEEHVERYDPYAMDRAVALAPAPGDLGLLLDEETKKRFGAMQKTLREIGKLREQDKLEKLQETKVEREPALIRDIEEIRQKAYVLVDARRKAREAAAYQVVQAPARPRAEQQGGGHTEPGWLCLDCGKGGKVEDLIGGEGAMACYKCGSSNLKHWMGSKQAPESDGEGDGGEEDQRENKKDFKDLKVSRPKKAAAGAKRTLDDTPPSVESATWPELKEALESGDRGVDKARQRQAIVVNRPKDGAPYTTFDTVLLKCAFLTRIELRLPEPVLSSEAFQLYFPGALSDGLLELILKDNGLDCIPAGLNQLQRLRALDLSHNKITNLPTEETWEAVSPTLELLDLSFNQLTSVVQLQPLKKLSQLKLDANRLTSLDGVHWQELKQLSTLSAVGNEISELSTDIGTHAQALERCDLSENKLVTIPTNLGELKKLKDLNITGNPIKDQKIVKAVDKGMKELRAYLSKIGGSKKK